MSPRLFRRLSPSLIVAPVLACTPAATPGSGTTSSSGSTGTTAPPELSPTEPTDTGSSSSGATTTGTPSTSTSSTTSAESTGPAAMCGDGTVDDGEECDDGVDNRDDGPCTLDCKQAICGDGLLHAGVEECDDGADNGPHYNGCASETCTKNAHCGDSNVDPGEECDNGSANGTDEGEGNTAPCSIGCTWDARIAFATSMLYSADFGGLEIADEICRGRAWVAGMPRWENFMAWLSDAELGPLDRFTLLPIKPYVLPTGERIADSLGELALDGPKDGIRIDEFGKPIPPSSQVWTGTTADGSPDDVAGHCQDWTTATSDLTTLTGRSHVPHEPADVWKAWRDNKWWTAFQAIDCDTEARLYCLEQ